jgi:hypothetical protein
MSLCFVIDKVGQDEKKNFDIAEANDFYANYTIECHDQE